MIRAALITAAVAAASATAHAGEITWDAPAGCPDGDAVRAQIAAELGREPAAADLDVAMRVERDGARWRLVLTAGGGERTLEAATCDELARSAALIVAMAIDEAAQAAPPPPPPPPPVDDPEPIAPRRQVDVSERTPDAPSPWRLRARAFAVGDLGMMPGPAAGAGGAVEVAVGAWGVEVAGTRLARQRAPMPGRPDDGAELAVTGIATRLCYTAARRRYASIGCAGGEVEVVAAAGYGFDQPLGRTTTFGGGPQAIVAWAYRVLGPLAARVDVGATLLLVRPVLVEGGTGVVIHDPNVLSWRGVIGLDASW